jgi:tRNA(Ile2) C34 agmatinyltransferase TiaS
MEEKKKRYHTYTSENTLIIRCYHCKNEWEEKGTLRKYKCKKCGRWGEGKAEL